MKRLKFLFLLLIIAVAVFGGFVGFGYYWLNTPLQEFKFSTRHSLSQNDKLVMINSGDNLSNVSERLKAEGVIFLPKIWLLYAKLSGKTLIKLGEYRLRAKDSPLAILNKLNSGAVEFYPVTFIEGQTFKEIHNTLRRTPKLNVVLRGKTPAEIIAILGVNISHLEGWFFPDTYHYAYGESDKDVLLRAHKKMQTTLSEQWANRMENLPYKNQYEALIMASIIEKETGAPFERADIAGVFVRRMHKKMRLQTDPTVIYGMGEDYTGNITRKDLRTPTPYNTYTIKGLPPTPIAMPGAEAIHAALNPAPGDALYFVAKGDGTHQFSGSLEEHNAAVRQYQHKRAKNYRSSIK